MAKPLTVHVERLEDVKPQIRKQLERLNDGWDGRMSTHLEEYGDRESDIANAKVFYILRGKTVASWGMVYNNRHTRRKIVTHPITGYSYSTCVGYRTSKANTADLYTRESQRGKGYASAIAKAMTEAYQGQRIRGCQNLTSVYKRHGFLNDL